MGQHEKNTSPGKHRRVAFSFTSMFPFLIAELPEMAEVIHVIDGDTLLVKMDERSDSVRLSLACVDAPEKLQPIGNASAKSLYALIPPGSQIEVQPVTVDRYGRTVAKIKSNDGIDINLKMVEDGNAVIYSQYFQPCRSQILEYDQAQKAAYTKSLGFWSQPKEKQTLPWIWRQQRRILSPGHKRALGEPIVPTTP